MSEYAHKVLAPKLTQKQRELLFQYFTELFSDGFESGDLSAWDGSYADNGCSVVGSDTSYPHHGSYNLKATIYAGGSARWALARKQLNGAYNPVHIRAMNCVFENEPDTSDTYRVMSFTNEAHGSAVAYAGIKYYNSAWRWWIYVRDNESFVNYYGGPVNFDTEYCMEFCVYSHGSAGYARLYVNGELEVEATGLDNDDRDLNYANVGFAYSAAGSSEAVFYADCVVVADTYIGPEATEQTYTKTWTTDALFKKLGLPKTLSMDTAFQKQDIPETFGLDVAFQKRFITQKHVDAFFKKLGIPKTLNIDTALQKQNIPETFGLDAAFQASFITQKHIDIFFKKFNIIENFAVDAHFGALTTQTMSKQVDVLFKKLDATATFGLDTYFGAVETQTYTETFGLDVVLAYKVRLPELWLDENGRIVLNISRPYTWVGT
jgi:hypothetical protein